MSNLKFTKIIQNSIRCLKNSILPLPKFHLKNILNWQPFYIPFDSGIPPLHPRLDKYYTLRLRYSSPSSKVSFLKEF
ncbi:hypothetical protein ERO13_A13G093945v2 [Gossypium hirsutum]|nr:hypothetical protein ERO13_A13G093945v2 [Gossypium hirsutum]KAG4165800.1 hypothetical protein ERO13_A13G093945v2 [Gossypium hirsutum]KAG4165801.1 hypothetical protein ERO13_A13G093945v2 [Gossypium hirsutum]KAG4165802.1 hypothetical protein ERO13_A13G093945v2 [Gossypium hirsutum]KAG4165803.1 hypothetical protein ERO13_A13G093945v2 [Gossypium hirsutum]